MRTFTSNLLALMAALCVITCDALPKDPEDTLARARGGVLRVGVSDAPPWVSRTADEPGEIGRAGVGSAAMDTAGIGPGGIEPEALRSFARSLDAEIRWHWAGAEENLLLLERRELDIVAAGLTTGSPWNGRVALTRPYSRSEGEERVLATSPGENALLVALERHLRTDPPGRDRGVP